MLKPYPEYRSFDGTWIKRIPQHWNEASLSALFFEHKAKNKGLINRNLLSLSYGKIIRKDISKGSGLTPDSYETYNVISENDIVLRLTDLQNDHKSLRTAISRENGIVTSAYITLRCRSDEYNIKYLHFFMHAFDAHKCFYSMGDGIRQNLSYDGIRRIKFSIPPRDEQDQIVRFLGWKASEMALFIKEKRSEIDLLVELKNSMICAAAIHGTHPKARCHDCSVEWIHTIPAHWDEITLFKCAAEQNLSNKTIHHQNLLSLSYGKIVCKDINTAEGLLPSSFDTYQIVHDGNIILRLTDLQNDHKSLRVGLSTQTGIITSA